MLLAPMSVDVTRGSRSVQASASWASDWPRPRAISFSARARSRLSSVSIEREKEPPRAARESSGIPSR
jgi:hypothetical protein